MLKTKAIALTLLTLLLGASANAGALRLAAKGAKKAPHAAALAVDFTAWAAFHAAI